MHSSDLVEELKRSSKWQFLQNANAPKLKQRPPIVKTIVKSFNPVVACTQLYTRLCWFIGLLVSNAFVFAAFSGRVSHFFIRSMVRHNLCPVSDFVSETLTIKFQFHAGERANEQTRYGDRVLILHFGGAQLAFYRISVILHVFST